MRGPRLYCKNWVPASAGTNGGCFCTRPAQRPEHHQRGNAMSDVAIVSQPWYRSLDRSQWNTLIASNLGWMFDGYETFALVMSVGAALRQLLEPSQYPQIPVYAGTLIALTLLGWGIGGLIGGVLADYIGRK